MPAPDHDRTEYQFTTRVPSPAKTVSVVGHANTDTHASVRGYDLEDVVENTEVNGITLERASFNDIDEQDGQHDPPEIVSELATELLPYEVASRIRGRLLRRHTSPKLAD